MKKFLLSTLFVLFSVLLFAAPFKNLPHTIVQPNGTEIHCFVSGDEFFNYVHDQEGYTIIQSQEDGYFYYATKNEEGKIIPSAYKVNEVDPKFTDLKKWVKISRDAYQKRVAYHNSFYTERTKAPHQGQMNNVVVYIRFADDTEFDLARQVYYDKLNPETGFTLRSYYKEVSYGKLDINSHHYPDCELNTNISYKDLNNRNYFRPYNASSNPEGYNGDTERRTREHQLLVNAINGVKAEIENTLTAQDIDKDNDGRVDNVTFIIRGNSDGWSDLLWAHRWVLYTFSVSIHGKQVYDYTFQPENQNSVTTLCHEMFHALGAPDLYHYYESTNIAPAGPWDLMEHGKGHMTAYMKWKYSNQTWISAIPEITTEGQYTLNPLSSSENNVYKIRPKNTSSSEYFVLEYRKKGGTFESYLPGSGLLAYRIDPSLNGNASGPPDELYVLRPGGTATVNGSINSAYLSAGVSRTELGNTTNPGALLSDGSESDIQIFDVSEAGENISFRVFYPELDPVKEFNLDLNSSISTLVSWESNNDNDSVMVLYSEQPAMGYPVAGETYQVGDVVPGGGTVLYKGKGENSVVHNNLDFSTKYYYKAISFNANKFSVGISSSINSQCMEEIDFPFIEQFENGVSDCWEITDHEGNGQVWQHGYVNAESFGFTSVGNGSLYVNSGGFGDGFTQSTELITNTMSFAGMNAVEVSFEHYLRYTSGTKAEFYYSDNNGESWTMLSTWNLNTNGVETYSVDLSTQLAGKEQVKFKWNYYASYSYYWIIDDFNVDGSYEASYISLSPKEVKVGEVDGSFNFQINSNVDWTVSSDQDWCVPVTTSGSGNASVEISYIGNEATNRTATLSISGTGVETQEIKVIQNTLSFENDIVEFVLDELISAAVIDKHNHTVTGEIASNVPINTLNPSIVISKDATINPPVNDGLDFSKPVVYTITAENGESQEWTVTITKLYASVTIDNLQFSDLEDGSSYYVGYKVRTNGVVTALDNNGYFIQKGSGFWKGIYVYDKENTPEIGDNLNLIGEVIEYNGLTELSSISSFETVSSGNSLPEALAVSVEEALKEEVEGVLIRLLDVTCVDADTEGNFGMWKVSDGTNEINIDDNMFAYQPEVDQKYHITGIGYYSYGEFKLLPRFAEDISNVTSVFSPLFSSLLIYPNPSEGMVNIEFGDKDFDLSVYNSIGQLVFSGSRSTSLNLKSFGSGMYHLVFRHQGQVHLEKVIVK